MRATRSDHARTNRQAATHFTASTAYGNTSYVASSPLVAPADPTRFDAMFAASPAHLSSMRSAAGAGASPYGAALDAASLDPSRFDDMFAASPAHLSKMRAASSGTAGVSERYDSKNGGARNHHHSLPMDANSARFTVVYDVVAGDESAAREKILAICLEQTVELPAALVPEGTWIREHVVGRLEKLEKGAGLRGSWRCEVSYHADTAGGEITQLINVVFGNTSMKEGVMVADLRLPPAVLAEYPGPRFGVEGLRRAVGVPRGPMIMTALKPMGSSTAELAKMAYAFAKGGIDIIKDDHGLADQPWAPYDERIKACAAAVARAARFRPAPSCSAVYRSLASVLTWTTRQLSTCSAVSAWRRPESSQAPTMPTLTASAPVRRVTSARRADGRPWLWVWRTKRRAK